MKLETIVTLEDGAKYYLADETVHEDKKYFLANKLDENDDLTDKSVIFEELTQNGEVFVDEVTNDKLINYLAAIFTANFIEAVDEYDPDEEE